MSGFSFADGSNSDSNLPVSDVVDANQAGLCARTDPTFSLVEYSNGLSLDYRLRLRINGVSFQETAPGQVILNLCMYYFRAVARLPYVTRSALPECASRQRLPLP